MTEQFEQVIVCDHPLIKHKLSILRNKDSEINDHSFVCPGF